MDKQIDVLFIHPRNYGKSQKYLKLPSLEFCQMAAILKNEGFEYKLLDFNINNIEVDDSKTELSSYSPKIVVIYGTENNHINLIATAKLTKELFPDALIGVNGSIVSFIIEHILENNFIDFVIKGTGEFTLAEILNHNCDLTKMEKVANLAYKIDDKIVDNKVEYISLKNLPIADRELYDLRTYKLHQPEAIVRSSWGCPSNCAFCNKTVFSKFRIYTIEHFFKEIDVLLKYGYNSFFFADETFAFSMKRLEEFCDFYKKNNYKFRWTSNLRVSDINDKLIKLMKENGAYRVFVGIETVSEESNKLTNKLQNITNLEDKINILKKNKMEFHASFIVGNPGDSKGDIEKTIEFVKKIKPTLATFNRLKLFPGTDIFINPEKYNLKVKDKYWFENPKWITEQMVCTNLLSYKEIEEYSRKMTFEMILN